MTGWWCAQSYANPSLPNISWACQRNREFSEKFSKKQASGGLMTAYPWKFDRSPRQLHESQALSCYSAKQAIEAQLQTMPCSITRVSDPETGANAQGIAQTRLTQLPQ